VWTWTALDSDSRMIISWLVGDRDAGCAYEFLTDLNSRLANRVQLTTDGHSAYLDAVEAVFSDEIDFAQLVKIYGNPPEGEQRYSPSECKGARARVISGAPDIRHISTSYAERMNLSIRMGMRRFTRLTNGFSKRIENHCHALALYFVFYNFVKAHKTLGGISPAMAAGVTDRLWEMSDILALVEAGEVPRKRGPYTKRVISN
jgi:IS1 family transposase